MTASWKWLTTNSKRQTGLSILLTSLVWLGTPVRAEISLDKMWPWDESVPKERPGLRKDTIPIEDAVNRDLMAQGYERDAFWETLNTFRMTWDGGTYFVAGWQYTSKEQMDRIHYEVKHKLSNTALPGGGICSLFLYDANLKLQAKHDVFLKEANGRTYCNGSNAMARVKGEDALLFSISYYLTDKPLAKRPQDIGNDWRYMTVLLRLRHEGNKVVIEQDDRCLGNPNPLRDIAAARKRLAQCQREQNVVAAR